MDKKLIFFCILVCLSCTAYAINIVDDSIFRMSFTNNSVNAPVDSAKSFYIYNNLRVGYDFVLTPPTASSTQYQESANQYDDPGAPYAYTSPGNMQDNVYTSYSGLSTTNDYMDIEYLKPANSFGGVLQVWRWTGAATETYNITIPQNCWDANATHVNVEVQSQSGGGGSIAWKCFTTPYIPTGTVSTMLSLGGSGYYPVDDSMWWNISSQQPDMSGNSKTMQLNGTAWSSGGLYLNGVTANGYVNNNLSYPNFTLAFTTNSTGNGGNQNTIFSNGGGYAIGGCEFGIWNANQFGFLCMNSSERCSTDRCYEGSAFTLSNYLDGDYHDFVLIMNTPTVSGFPRNNLTLYIDGKNFGSYLFKNVTRYENSTNYSYIGRRAYPGSEQYFKGAIKNLYFFNRTISYPEIVALNKKMNPGVDRFSRVDKSTNVSSSWNSTLVVQNTSIADYSNFSVSFWMNPKYLPTSPFATNNGAGLVSTGFNEWEIYANSTAWRFYIKDVNTVQYAYTFPLNSWTHLGATYNGTKMIVYMNGIAVDSKDVAGTKPNTAEHLYIGRRPTIGLGGEDSFFDGAIDEVKLFNRSLSSFEMLNLYSAFDMYGMVNVTSNISNQTGFNGDFDIKFTIQNSTNIDPFYTECNIDTNESGTIMCTMPDAYTANCHMNTLDPYAFNAKVNISCWYGDTDGESDYVFYDQTDRIILFDNVNPTITTEGFTNNLHRMLTNITANFTFADAFSLYSWNLSVDGVQIAGGYNVSYNSYKYLMNLSPSAYSYGNHTLRLRVADGHTANEIGDYQVTKGGLFDDASLEFKTGKNIVKVKSENDISKLDRYSYYKEKDRYKFSVIPGEANLELKEEIKINDKNYTKHSFIIETEQPLYVYERNKTKMQRWIISGNNWIDFYNDKYPADKVKIDQLSEKMAKVTVYAPSEETKLDFNSIGDLNIVEVNYSFFTMNATVTYSSSILEQQSNTIIFKVNTTGTSYTFDSINANITYNNTILTTLKTQDSSAIYFTATTYSPDVAADTNITILVNYTMPNETGYLNMTQAVSAINIGDCASNPSWIKALQIFGYDEQNLTLINSSIVNMTLNMMIEMNSNIEQQFSFQFRNSNNYSICINPNSSTYNINSKMEYGDGVYYTQKKYYLNNYNLSNVTQNLTLYHLPQDVTSDVILTLYDKNTGRRLVNAFVKVLRYYPGYDNTTDGAAYKTVEIEQTDNDGQTLAKMILGDVWYKFIVEYPVGTVVLNSDIQKILTVDKLIPISLRSGSLMDYNSLLQLSSDVTCTKSTQTCRFTWSTADGSEITGELRVYEDTGFAKRLIYSSQVTSASASIPYTVANISGKRIVAEGWVVS